MRIGLDRQTAVCLAGLMCVASVFGCRGHVDGCTGASRRAPAQSMDATAPDQVRLVLHGPGLAGPRTYTLADLAAMEQTKLSDVLMSKSHSPDERTSWRGPSLQLLLDDAGVKPGPMDLDLVAGDGYRVTCSLADVRSAIVAVQDGEGRWLHELDDRCALRLVPPELPGNYWVMNIARITVAPRAAGSGS